MKAILTVKDREDSLASLRFNVAGQGVTHLEEIAGRFIDSHGLEYFELLFRRECTDAPRLVYNRGKFRVAGALLHGRGRVYDHHPLSIEEKKAPV